MVKEVGVKTYWEMDLAINHVSKSKNPELQGNNYDHLMELTEYDWNKDHKAEIKQYICES